MEPQLRAARRARARLPSSRPWLEGRGFFFFSLSASKKEKKVKEKNSTTFFLLSLSASASTSSLLLFLPPSAPRSRQRKKEKTTTQIHCDLLFAVLRKKSPTEKRDATLLFFFSSLFLSLSLFLYLSLLPSFPSSLLALQPRRRHHRHGQVHAHGQLPQRLGVDDVARRDGPGNHPDARERRKK